MLRQTCSDKNDIDLVCGPSFKSINSESLPSKNMVPFL